MHEFQALLLDVWREACRHIEIERSAQTITHILSKRLPIECLIVVAIDFTQNQLLPRANGMTEGAGNYLQTPSAIKPADRRLLREWGSRQMVSLLQAGDDPDPVMALLLESTTTDGSWIVGPLMDEHDVAGALLVRVASSEVLDPLHLQMVELLLEPFSVALENDQRLHELSTLREAAEADKRSALSRLGREDLVDSLVGADGGLKAVMDRVSLVARSDLPVLILGETGSGKEVIARNIHDQSPRAKGPFIRVNCGAIPSELIDSELFGHEKGAFTGATSLRRGWFERADKGTLLLDEIGELPLAAQVRLLRVIQEGSFERVGGESPIRVNVRIVAATHRDLPNMIQEGDFREDLWYRIASFPIVLPPLRERKQDIPALAMHFAKRAARRFGLRMCAPSEEDLRLLMEYAWPGNIRELASVIDRAAILGDGARLEVVKALGPLSNTEVTSTHTIHHAKMERNQVCTLDHAMREHIKTALQQTQGRIEGAKGAAKMLDINPHTLRARMRKLGIVWTQFRQDSM